MTTSHPLAWPDGWARTPDHRRHSRARFTATFDAARGRLFRELRLLGAQGVVVSSWLPLRNDGMPRSDAARRRIDDPGVAVYFLLRNRKMVMARDLYATVHDNLRSIGMAIEHLRGLERHGGATMMERAFEGFAALPPPAGSKAARPWRTVLGLEGLECNIPAVVLAGAESAYRTLARDAHPDRGGSPEAMAELNQAIAAARAEFAGV